MKQSRLCLSLVVAERAGPSMQLGNCILHLRGAHQYIKPSQGNAGLFCRSQERPGSQGWSVIRQLQKPFFFAAECSGRRSRGCKKQVTYLVAHVGWPGSLAKTLPNQLHSPKPAALQLPSGRGLIFVSTKGQRFGRGCLNGSRGSSLPSSSLGYTLAR